MKAALFVAIFVAIFAAILLPLLSAQARQKQKERRMAEHRMNARLLRLNI